MAFRVLGNENGSKLVPLIPIIETGFQTEHNISFLK